MAGIKGFGIAPRDETHDTIFVYWAPGYWPGHTRNVWHTYRKPGKNDPGKKTSEEVARGLARRHGGVYLGQVESLSKAEVMEAWR